jgi:hypothetical protein
MKKFLGSYQLRSLFLRAAAAAALTVGLAGLVGCSGGGGSNSATGLLKQTFSSHPIHSGKVALDLSLNLQGVRSLPGPIDIKLDGPFQSAGSKQFPKFNLTLSFAGTGQNLSAGLISTGDKGYLTFQGKPYAVPDAQFASFRQSYLQARANSQKKGTSTLASLGVDPSRWLINPRKAGTQDVGGAQAIHITSGIDVARFMDDVNTLLSKANRLGASNVASIPQSLTPQQRSAVTRSVQSATVDVYTGASDKILRRLAFTLNLAVPPDLRSAASGLTGGTISFDLLLANVNQPQTISAPGNALPLTSLLGQLSSSSSAGSGSGRTAPRGTGTGSGSGSGAGSGSASQSAYLQCVQRAAGNIKALQQCASLVGH